MDPSIMTAVTQLGFPVAACMFLAWYVKDTNDKHREDLKELNKTHSAEVKEMNDAHRDEMYQLKEAVDNNTAMVQRLIDVISLKEGVEKL